MERMSNISKIRTRRTRCANCNIPMVKQDPGNEPAYCQYQCGAEAQPQHTKKVLHSTGQHG